MSVATVERSAPPPGPELYAVPARPVPAGVGGATGSNPSRLDVLPALAPLLPDGALRRGSTVAVSGSTALLLALLAGPSADGAWCAVVGVPTLGVRAAAESGIDLRRLALVPEPGAQWSGVVAALLDGIDVVAVLPSGRNRVGAGEARRLSARARERRAVLVPVGRWDGADVRLTVDHAEAAWSGMASGPGAGTGRLRTRRLPARADGRGAASRPRRAELWLPGPDAAPGAVPVDPVRAVG